MTDKYKSMPVAEMRKIAAEKGIQDPGSIRKPELAALLNALEADVSKKSLPEPSENPEKRKTNSKTPGKSTKKSEETNTDTEKAVKVRKASSGRKTTVKKTEVSRTTSGNISIQETLQVKEASQTEKKPEGIPAAAEKKETTDQSPENTGNNPRASRGRNSNSPVVHDGHRNQEFRRNQGSGRQTDQQRNSGSNANRNTNRNSNQNSNAGQDRKVNSSRNTGTYTKNDQRTRTNRTPVNRVQSPRPAAEKPAESAETSVKAEMIREILQEPIRSVETSQVSETISSVTEASEKTVLSVNETESEKSVEVQQNTPKYPTDIASEDKAVGVLEVMPDGFGFIRSNEYLPGDEDVYVAPSQIKKFNLKTGDRISGVKRIKAPTEKFSAILFIEKINGMSSADHSKVTAFENLTPVFPHERLHLETADGSISMRITDLLSPIGKGQRGMIVAQPKVGKTTLLKQITRALLDNHPRLHIIVLLIDERPEEVTDMKETFPTGNVEIVYSTFDELPEHHKHVSEMVIERAKRLVELKQDVVILLDSITRLTRAYNITVTPSGRTLSGGLDPAALYMPKRFFGAARCMKEGGSLTILATALQDTGSRLDDVVYEEFKGTGNMELVLDRKLSERRIFPAIDILKSGTRRDDLLLTQEEQEAVNMIRRATNANRPDEAAERILDLFSTTASNEEFLKKIKFTKLI